MWTTRLTLLLAIWPLLIEAESHLLVGYTNGWIPVSSEVVYDQIKRQGGPIPQYIAANTLHANINEVLPKKILATSKIQPHFNGNVEHFKEKHDDCDTEDDSTCNRAKLTNIPVQNVNINSDEFQHSIDQYETDNKTVRRSKKIADLNSNDYLLQKLFLPENPSPKSKTNTYEVTEDTVEGESKTKNDGYKYEPELKKKNQTLELFDILSKYKIHKDDELPNYVLSRKVKPPVKTQTYRYNNNNHLPLDPLLAVFLSNYGFYLQGMYGIQNQYNNLYGYLASNNIHNNRPFGVYKIYSDTDSSH